MKKKKNENEKGKGCLVIQWSVDEKKKTVGVAVYPVPEYETMQHAMIRAVRFFDRATGFNTENEALLYASGLKKRYGERCVKFVNWADKKAVVL